MAQYSHGFHTLFYSEGPSVIPVYCHNDQEHTNGSAKVICIDFCSQCHLLYAVMQVKCNGTRYGEKEGQEKVEKPFNFIQHTFSKWLTREGFYNLNLPFQQMKPQLSSCVVQIHL